MQRNPDLRICYDRVGTDDLAFGQRVLQQRREAALLDATGAATPREAVRTLEPAMNFGRLPDTTDDEEYERVVVHEVGHALGCIHEHQSPTEKLRWNEAAVFAAFGGPPNNWDRATIESNILEKYSHKGIH